MIVAYLVQVMTGLVLALAGVLGAGLLVSYQQKRAARSRHRKARKAPRLDTRVAAILANVESAFRQHGPNLGVVNGYEIIRTEMTSVEVDQPKGSTEREFVDRLSQQPNFATVRANLAGLYQAYERARFGKKDLSEREVADFVEDARGILHHIDYALRGVAG